MVFARHAGAVADKIVEERMRHCKTMPAATANDSYASQSRTNASIAGAACTYKILRLTVAAP